MFVRRAAFLGVLLCLLTTLPSNLKLVFAEGQLPRLASVCHDGIWDDGEYCGRDARTVTGRPDMNHDCFVDALDVALFFAQFGNAGPGLSGDLNGNGFVTAADFTMFLAPAVGLPVSPCNPTPIPTACDGIIALSFHTDPTTIVNNASQPPSVVQSVYVVVLGVTNAKSVEFWVKGSPNVAITSCEAFGGVGSISGGGTWGVGIFTTPTTGSATVARVDYHLTDSNPATIFIATPWIAWGRNRWAAPDAPVSHGFAGALPVGINGLTPGSSTTCAPTGQITGTVYSDPGDDCTFNGGDTQLSGRAVMATPGPHFAYTDGNGNYTFTLLPNTYTVSMFGFNSPWKKLSSCQTPTHTVPVAPNTTSSGWDFALAPAGTIKGRVFSDGTTPCVFDAGSDVGTGGRKVEANLGSYVGYCDASGNYSLNVPVGAYTVTQPPVAGDPWVFPGCFAGSHPANVTANGTLTGLDFPLNLSGTACNLTVRIVSNGINFAAPPCQTVMLDGPCPGIEHEYLVWVWGDPYLSDQTVPAGKIITVTLDPAFTINSVSGDCDHTITATPSPNARQIRFDESIPPGTKCTLKIHATPADLGPYTHTASFNPQMACSGTLVTLLSETNGCNACDPNDMHVQPGCGPNGEVLPDEPLAYTVRFENIGLGAAHNIFIEGILDADLDPNTLYIVDSSHPVTGVQLEAGNKLVISLEDINLPGTTEAPSNRGYVIYSVNQDAGLPDGTTITNSAEIFFDFNEPVVTNTETTTVKNDPCAATAVDQPRVPSATYLGQNHPNPFNPSTTIEYGLVSSELVSIQVYNVRGELVHTLVNEHKTPGWYSVDWDGRDQRGNRVASGVYLSRMSAGAFVDTKKLILLK